MSEAIKHTIELEGGITNELLVYRTVENVNTVVLVLPALGVRASYYKPFCIALAQKGLHAATIDWRGNGTSSVRPSYEVDYGYQDLIDDTVKVIFQLDKVFPQSKKIIIGHSLGGQIGSLLMSRHPLLMEQLFLVAACNVYYEGFIGQERKIKRAAKWIPIIATFFGHFPGKWVGFGGKEARGVMADWSDNALTGLYELAREDFDYEKAMSLCTNPITAISLEGDNLAPKEAVGNLVEKFKSSTKNIHIEATSEDFGIDDLSHFNWVKHPNYIVDLVKGRV